MTWAQDSSSQDLQEAEDKQNPLLYPKLLKKKINRPNLKGQSYIQSENRFKVLAKTKTIDLSGSIEQGLRVNYSEIDRIHQKNILDLSWKDTKDGFWLPNINLTLTSANQRIANFKRGRNNIGPSDERLPLGSLRLGADDYTVFNWGKDYLAYLNSLENYKQSDRNLKESKRDLRHTIIQKYFQLYFFTKVEEARRTQLRHASFVYRYNRENVALKKVTKQEYYQSRSEYLKAQNDYRLSKQQLKVISEEFAYLISDQPGTLYQFNNGFNYQLLKLTLNESTSIGEKNNNNILDAQSSVNIAKREQEITFRENLPLPKFSINLGGYTHYFGKQQNNTIYETQSGNSNIELVASVNATWNLTGPGGLFNQRSTDIKLIQRKRAFNQLASSKHQNLSNIQTSFYKIKNYEEQIKIFDARKKTLQKTFDTILDNYLNRKTAYINFQDSLLEMVDVEILFEQYRYLHLLEKVSLAKEMGVTDFPGENFETIAGKE